MAAWKKKNLTLEETPQYEASKLIASPANGHLSEVIEQDDESASPNIHNDSKSVTSVVATDKKVSKKFKRKRIITERDQRQGFYDQLSQEVESNLGLSESIITTSLLTPSQQTNGKQQPSSTLINTKEKSSFDTKYLQSKSSIKSVESAGLNHDQSISQFSASLEASTEIEKQAEIDAQMLEMQLKQDIQAKYQKHKLFCVMLQLYCFMIAVILAYVYKNKYSFIVPDFPDVIPSEFIDIPQYHKLDSLWDIQNCTSIIINEVKEIKRSSEVMYDREQVRLIEELLLHLKKIFDQLGMPLHKNLLQALHEYHVDSAVNPKNTQQCMEQISHTFKNFVLQQESNRLFEDGSELDKRELRRQVDVLLYYDCFK